MATFGGYVFGWLVGYSGLLGPVAEHYDRRLLHPASYKGSIRTRSIAVADAMNTVTASIRLPSSPLVLGVIAAHRALRSKSCLPLYIYAWFIRYNNRGRGARRHIRHTGASCHRMVSPSQALGVVVSTPLPDAQQAGVP